MRSIPAFCLLLLSLAPPAWAAEPPSLLLPNAAPADAGQESRQRQILYNTSRSPGVARSRLARLNREALARLQAGAAAGRRLRVELFPDVTATVRIEKADKDDLGFVVIQGRVEEDRLGGFNLVLRDGVAMGTIDYLGRFFRITHVEGDVVAVAEIDRSAFPNEAQPLLPSYASSEPPTPDPDPAAAETQIDVLVVYTTDARIAAGGIPQIQAQVGLAVAQLNQALANSGQNVTAALAGIAELPYQETGDPGTDLASVSSDSTVAEWRSAWQADVVSLFVEKMNGACGMANVMTDNSTSFAPLAFNVVQRNCATDNYSFAHEVGHNLGCQHDRANASGASAFSYSFGYQAPDRAFRTTLAYECAGGTCRRVLYYSNPDVALQGQPTGIDPAAADSADNALTIQNTAPTAAQFSDGMPTNTFGVYDLNSGKGIAGLDPGYANLPRFQADVNADHRADYCRFVGNPPDVFLSCALSTGTGFGNYDFNSGAIDPGIAVMPALMADVNADGRADYCRFIGNPPNLSFSCALAAASGFGDDEITSGQGKASFDPGFDTMPSYLVDVNADGRADYCRFVGTPPGIFLSCAFATQSGFGNYDFNSGLAPASFDAGYAGMPRLMADVNADGRADYCRFVGNPPDLFLSCALATASSFGNYDVNSGKGLKELDPGYGSMPSYLVDVDDDGRADYCRFVGDPPYVFLGCALATDTNSFGNYDVDSPISYDAGYPTMPQSMADVNADGKADYCRFVGDPPEVFLSCGLARVEP